MKKKIIFLTMLILMIFTLGIVNAFDGKIITKEYSEKDIKLKFPNYSSRPYKVGDIFSIELDINSMDIKAGDFRIKYPAEKLQFISSKLNSNFYVVQEPEEGSEWGYINCSMIDMDIENEDEDVDVDLSLGSLLFTFKALVSGSSTIYAEIDGLYQLDGTKFECDDCEINIHILFENNNLSFVEFFPTNDLYPRNDALIGIEENTKINELFSETNINPEYTVIIDGEEIDKNDQTKIATTGQKILILRKLENENNEYELIENFYIVIYGDTNGNGTIDALDALIIIKNKLNLIKFENVIYQEAGRTTIDTRYNKKQPSAVDALAIVKHKLNLEKIVQIEPKEENM